MTRVFVKRSETRTALTWQEKYPTNYSYSSPPEVERLKEVLREAKTKREATPRQFVAGRNEQ
jgi:hypothetical protein